MQDLSDGSMRDLTPFLKDIPTVKPEEMAKMLADVNALQARISELDAAVKDRQAGFEESAKGDSERSVTDFTRKRFNEELQKAKDSVQPDRTKQGPVFMEGEVLEIRGWRFQITKIEPGHMRLKGLPK